MSAETQYIERLSAVQAGKEAQFTLRLDAELSKMAFELAGWTGLKQSDVHRALIRFAHPLVLAFREHYKVESTAELVSFETVLANHYDTTELTMKQERAKEFEKMRAWCKLKACDGGEINYQLASEAVHFYLGAWEHGLSVDEALAKFKQAQVDAAAAAASSALEARQAAEQAERLGGVRLNDAEYDKLKETYRAELANTKQHSQEQVEFLQAWNRIFLIAAAGAMLLAIGTIALQFFIH